MGYFSLRCCSNIMGILLMAYGMEAYSESGVLQFDTDYPQYTYSKLVSKPINTVNATSYTANEAHLIVTVPRGDTTPAGLCPVITSHTYQGNNSYSVGFMAMYGEVFNKKLTGVIFTPFNLLVTGPSTIGVGLECYDSSGKVTYSSMHPNLKVVATHVLPAEDKASQMLYGKGTGVMDAWSYKWKSNVRASNVTDFGIAFSQKRIGNFVEYNGSGTVIILHDAAIFSISSDGYLEVTFRAVIGDELNFGGGFGEIKTWVMQGTQIAYIVDVRSIKHLIT